MPPPKPRPCPICGKPAEPRFRPFCSARCKTIDLGRWLGDRYAIPGDEPPDGDAPADGER
ncbi:MAG TPA: DNA gyrase inhibitor YacG [Stellaceae bacterium]|nr:DNA gyrase inhibitor YacG [Stellaceae bacterium]